MKVEFGSMILNFFDALKEFVDSLFQKFNFSSFATFFSGIILGFIICFLIYLGFLLSAIKKDEKLLQKNNDSIDDEAIKKLIRNSKNSYMEDCSGLSTVKKLDEVKKISLNLINDIAKIYYPKSSYPLYELSIDEIMVLAHYITDRINSIFKGPILKNVKKIRISQVLKIIDIKKKMDDNKVVKAANKVKVPKVATGVFAVLNVFNPVYWVKKIMINTTIVAISNKLALTIIDVVGEETTKVYSKNVFNSEKTISTDIDKSICELENMIEEEK